MSKTKQQLLSTLEELRIETPISPDGIFVLHEDAYPLLSDDWKMVFTDHHNSDGASTISVNRQTGTLVLFYDAKDTRYREYLVFGDLSEFEAIGNDEEFSLDPKENSLWHNEEHVWYTEYLCDHLVKDMKFGDEIQASLSIDGLTVEVDGKTHRFSMEEAIAEFGNLDADKFYTELEKRFL
ncbi:hypothetical protein QTO02_11180 [Vibrio fortis]